MSNKNRFFPLLTLILALAFLSGCQQGTIEQASGQTGTKGLAAGDPFFAWIQGSSSIGQQGAVTIDDLKESEGAATENSSFSEGGSSENDFSEMDPSGEEETEAGYSLSPEEEAYYESLPVVLVTALSEEARTENEGQVVFSLDSGIYGTDQLLKLESAPDPDETDQGVTFLYYTLNGEDPRSQGILYQGGILLKLQDTGLSVIPVKAFARSEETLPDGTKKVTDTAVFTRSYVICPDTEAYGDLMIVSLSAEDQDLNGPEGLYTNPNTGLIVGGTMTCFSEDGTVLYEDGVGLQLTGATSQLGANKSFKVIAKELYGESEYFLFSPDENTSDTERDYHYVTQVKNLKIRDGSQDYTMGNIRSSLVSRLYEESGLSGAPDSQRVLVYVNGDFYAIGDLQNSYSTYSLGQRYGLDGDLIEQRHTNEIFVMQEAGVWDLAQHLETEEDRAALEELIDLDDYFYHVAIQCILCNTDWPNNNFYAWRYTGEPIEGNPYSDGRLRFLFVDTDLIYQTASCPDFFEGCKTCSFENIMTGALVQSQGSLFPFLMAYDGYKSRFLTIVADLYNTTFQASNILSIIDSEWEIIEPATRLLRGNGIYQQAVSLLNEMKESVPEREAELKTMLAKYLGVSGTYHATVTGGEGCEITWVSGDVMSQESYECDYYTDSLITFTAVPSAGYAFDWWVINENVYFGQEVTLTKEMIASGSVTVEVRCHRDENAGLVIQEVHNHEDGEWVVLLNPTDHAICLADYSLSDSQVPDEFLLPDQEVGPGETVVLYGKNASCIGIRLSFGLSKGEKLTLYRNRKVLDQVCIPKMTEGEYYGRKASCGGSFVFMRETS